MSTDQPKAVTVIYFTWEWDFPNSSLPFVKVWEENAPVMDARCSISLHVVGGESPQIKLRGLCTTDTNTATQLMQVFLDAPKPGKAYPGNGLFPSNWTDAYYRLSDCWTLENCTREAHKGPNDNSFKDNSNGWMEDTAYWYSPLASPTISTILANTWYMCTDSSHFCGALFTADGNNTASCLYGDETAFPHRCTRGHLEYLLNVNISDSNVDKMEQLFNFTFKNILFFKELKHEPYIGYITKDFCDQNPDGKWANMTFAGNQNIINQLCEVHCRIDPKGIGKSPCPFDFCNCH